MAVDLGFLSAIVVLNAKYYPQSTTSAANVGATSFTFSVMRVLLKAGLLKGMILYQRQEGITSPSYILERRRGVLCAVLSFNFNMHAIDVQVAIAAAAKSLGNSITDRAILYYQTDTLLDYHPTWLPCAVTHHGPFYDDFTQQFSPELAALAFGSDEKARHLQRQQKSGIRYLRSNSNAFILQHSKLQREHLLRNGVDPNRIRKLSPPIELSSQSSQSDSAVIPLLDFADPNAVLLFTTVARLDYFKNVELLIDSGVELLRRGKPIRVLVAGDSEDQDDRRVALLNRVPREFRHRFSIIPKLPKTDLYDSFHAAQNRGIFVCPSRFETLGICPMEAALSGVTTLISDSKQVEASQYFPSKYRFRANVQHLADTLQCAIRQDLGGLGVELARKMQKVVSEQRFERDLVRAWGEFSSSARAVAAA